MIYGLSLLFVLLGLVLLIPASRKLLYMRDVKKNSGTTAGTVLSSKSATGWLWASSFGNQDRPLVQYYSPKGTEIMLEVVSSSLLPQKRYEQGESVNVVYDQASPSRAFVAAEWQATLHDFWLSIAALLIAILLWVVGRIYNLPF